MNLATYQLTSKTNHNLLNNKKIPFVGQKTIQRKLSIGSSNDAYEVEADRIADQVVGMSESQVSRSPHMGPLIQRKCSACEKEEKIQKKSLAESITPVIMTKGISQEGGQASESLTNRIQNSSSGAKMDADTQDFMESRFGTDFSEVRIHTGANAIKMSRELNAQAFTVGNDVFFNEGKYSPTSNTGKHLLAHELTHMLQQSGIRRKMIQRDWAIEPINQSSDVDLLNDEEIQSAIRYNSYRFFDRSELALLRDVLGLNEEPTIVDREFVLAVANYQHQFGETIDGKLGSDSAQKLTRELFAEDEDSAGHEMNVRTIGSQSVQNVDSGSRADIFDAHLDHANARLTLIMKINFNFVGGGAGAWPNANTQDNWVDSFKRLIQNRWSYKLLMRRNRPSRRYLKYYATRVQIIPTNVSPHYTANVSYESSHVGSSVSTVSNTATLDSYDTEYRTLTRGGRNYRRRVGIHEFGHMLGLDHIECNANTDNCYGTNRANRLNIMGFGRSITTTNATPFLDAMNAITGFAWVARRFRRLI